VCLLDQQAEEGIFTSWFEAPAVKDESVALQKV